MTKFTYAKCLLIVAAMLMRRVEVAGSQLVQDAEDLQPYDVRIEEDESDGGDTMHVAQCAVDTTIPAHATYRGVWNTSEVNPYGVSLLNMTDTVTLDLSGYTHPNLNVITSRFGFRRWKFHYGIDLRCAVGDSIRCAFDGRVRLARRGKAYGYYVVVRHYNGLETTYAHMSKILVSVDEEVKSGDLIGWGGNTGRSTGPHLHFEMRYLGEAVDPATLVDFAAGKPYLSEVILTADNFSYINEVNQLRYWVVRSGDSLSKIARQTGISVERLCKLNGIKRTSILKVGQRIRYT